MNDRSRNPYDNDANRSLHSDGVIDAAARGSNRPMQLIVVLNISKEDGAQVYANACAVLEDCMTLTKAEWNTEDGVAIFVGVALQALSTCSARIYSSDATKSRVRSIDYRVVRLDATPNKR